MNKFLIVFLSFILTYSYASEMKQPMPKPERDRTIKLEVEDLGQWGNSLYDKIHLGIINKNRNDNEGLAIALMVNHSRSFSGVQIAPVNYAAGRFRGVQMGLINHADNFDKGVQIGLYNSSHNINSALQIGLLNVIMTRDDDYDDVPEENIPALAIINWRF